MTAGTMRYAECGLVAAGEPCADREQDAQRGITLSSGGRDQADKMLAGSQMCEPVPTEFHAAALRPGSRESSRIRVWGTISLR